MDYRKRGSHARGVYPTHYTSRIGTVRVKQEEEIDIRIIREGKRKNLKQGLTSVKDQIIELPKEDESPYNID